ncbi:membrane-spanning 4-domains subfamily A member 4A-like isoform X2 [Podarcis raffonei]|uniref:membrane-spanning 4-domains subfamily A member 4A-like isoform X2 n=1 Tax=Podarcis raffonei TaxID=65483 RepID=UPI0023291F0B|nr:membrane-spanning 4-domains subfamily A member 4A-like isoform X2 [Podarcis raffonei]
MDSTLTAPPWPSSLRDESDASVPKSVKKFYRGEPLALGITQILLGITHIAFGAVFNLMDDHRGSYIAIEQPLWAGILYIISGSLSVAAARNPKVPMVKGMLGMNVVSSVAASVGIMSLCFQLEFYSPGWEAEYFCHYEYSGNTTLSECIKTHMLPWVVVVYQNATPGDALGLPAACKDPDSP